MTECPICFQDTDSELCTDCLAWKQYWNNLTDDERLSEYAAMVAYTQSCEDEQ